MQHPRAAASRGILCVPGEARISAGRVRARGQARFRLRAAAVHRAEGAGATHPALLPPRRGGARRVPPRGGHARGRGRARGARPEASALKTPRAEAPALRRASERTTAKAAALEPVFVPAGGVREERRQVTRPPGTRGRARARKLENANEHQ
eukprot:scaffold664_cov129-Isochrysis_galbana.AAC.11